jgi:hypothetical protein
LEVESCATYELKNVGSGGLLFERLVTFASELREFAFLIDGWRFAALCRALPRPFDGAL